MKLARILLVGLSTFCASLGGAQDRPGDFDFYVLSLSWSPTWCATDDSASRSRQCRAGARHGFIVHGLWPQYEQGYPEFCYEGEPEWVASAVADRMRDIMPDRQLVFSEWRKHGTCTGLSPADYFAVTRAAMDRVTIPKEFLDAGRDRTRSADAVEAAFLSANDGLEADAVAVACADGRLEEVRICLTQDLAFRPCEEVDRDGCRQARLLVQAPF